MTTLTLTSTLIKNSKLHLKKWTVTMGLAFTQVMVYRANFLLQIVGPGLFFFLVKYFLWLKIYEDRARLIQNFTFNQMITYHLWVMVVSLINQGATSSNLAEDIRLGRISAYLIYPFNFWEFHFAQFLSNLILQILVGAFLLLVSFVFFYFGLGGAHLNLNLDFTSAQFFWGVVVTLLTALWWYGCQFVIGLGGLWLEETWTIRVILQILAQFFSGAFLPLSFFPEIWQRILHWTPFPLLIDLPVKIFLGQKLMSWEIFFQITLQLFLIIMLGIFVWKKGLKRYTGAGM
jgi:ABC-2 type transport system permease protein